MVSFLQKVVDGKVNVDKLLSSSTVKELLKDPYATGAAFKYDKGNVRSKILSEDTNFESYLNGFLGRSVNKEKDMETLHKEGVLDVESLEMATISKKSWVIYAIFLIQLSEIGISNKEQSRLLFEAFKQYFVLQETKYLKLFQKSQEKESFFRGLFNKQNSEIDSFEVTDLLHNNKLSRENLAIHKEMIKRFLSIINEKNAEIRKKNTTIKLKEKEAEMWVHDYNNIKTNQAAIFKLQSKEIKDVIETSVNSLSRLDLKPIQRSFLTNSELFLHLSGKLDYIYEERKRYNAEIIQLNEKIKQLTREKTVLKEESVEKQIDLTIEIEKLRSSVEKLRYQLRWEKEDLSTQTEISMMKMNKMTKTYEQTMKRGVNY